MVFHHEIEFGFKEPSLSEANLRKSEETPRSSLKENYLDPSKRIF